MNFPKVIQSRKGRIKTEVIHLFLTMHFLIQCSINKTSVMLAMERKTRNSIPRHAPYISPCTSLA